MRLLFIVLLCSLILPVIQKNHHVLAGQQPLSSSLSEDIDDPREPRMAINQYAQIIGYLHPPFSFSLSEPIAVETAPLRAGQFLGAAARAVLITEVMMNPEDSPEKSFEWIELFNTTSSDMELGNWTLTDNSSTDILPAFTLSAGEFVIIRASSNTLPSFNGNIITLDDGAIGNQLGNSGDSLLLQDQLGTAIDAISWGSSTDYLDPSPDSAAEGLSLQRVTTSGSTVNTADNFVEAEITPGAAYQSNDPEEKEPEDQSPITYSNDIYINEILPAPDSSQVEFIELYNASSEAVDLSNWVLDDIADGGSSPYTIPTGTTIGANEYLVFFKEIDNDVLATRLILNNTEDEARLLSPDEELKDSFAYIETNPNEAYARDSDLSWKTTKTLTPGAVNVIDNMEAENSEYEEAEQQTGNTDGVTVTISQAKAEENGEVVFVRGWVTSPPGNLGSNRMYIQDDSGAGIAVEMSGGLPASVAQDDYVQVSGEVSEKYSERFIRATNVEELSDTRSIPAQATNTSAVEEEKNEGELLVITGTVTRQSGDSFYIDDGSGEIRVLIRSSTDITKPELNAGATVEVAGIVSQYKTSSTNGTGYRLLPRFQSDLKVVLPTTGPSTDLLLPSILTLALMQLIFLLFTQAVKLYEIDNKSFS